jgi:hypothetical protein
MTTPKFVGPYCLKQRRLAKIWRAIARRHLSRLRPLADAEWHELMGDNDGETDP